MSSLPDRKRPRLTQPVRALAASVVRLASHSAWRVLHPADRAPFLDAPRPVPLRRVYYESGDGWRAPLWRIDPLPGAPGEPVVLAHGLGSAADALRYGTGPTLAGALRDAGFAVFLWAHRGDAEGLPPPGPARSRVDFDAILERDLPAAVERVTDAAGMERVHFVGHGLGGQLGLCWATSRPESLASLVALSAPMRFSPLSAARRGHRALSLLPAAWRLPLRAAGRLGAPLLAEHDLEGPLGLCHTAGQRVRGLLTYGTEDLPVGLLRQVLSWYERGAPTSADGLLDWSEALHRAEVPLLAVCGAEDPVCPPADARVAVERWGAQAAFREVPALGHLDMLHADDVDQDVFTPIVDWLVGHRRRSWLDASTTGATLAESTGAPWPRVGNA